MTDDRGLLVALGIIVGGSILALAFYVWVYS